MPTGYTAMVRERDDVTFNEFLWQCARAMGACILMRDDPLDKLPPEKFEPSDWHQKSIDAARATLFDLERMTAAEIQAAADADYNNLLEQYETGVKERRNTEARYSRMLALVDEWQPPTSDHQGLKKFMREQLTESIRWDCGGEEYYKPPKKKSPDVWLADKKAGVSETIANYSRYHAEEVARTNERNAWIKALRDSVPMPETAS